MFPHAHIEDFTVGDVFEYGAYAVTEAEILEFGRRFDPQSYHTDPEAAKTGPFNGLIASGLHTGSIFLRLLIDAFPNAVSLGSPGWDETRWTAPVRPGDVLSARSEVVEARLSKTRPDRGLISMQNVLSNQDGEMVFRVLNYWFIGRRGEG